MLKVKKVFLDDLPRFKEGRLKGKVNWNASVGRDVKFIYNDIEGTCKLIKYDNYILTIEIGEQTYDIAISNFVRCGLGRILGKKNMEHLHSVGAIITDVTSGKLLITNQMRYGKTNSKGYEYECLICKNIDSILESSLVTRKSGCTVCSNKKILNGYNDMWTTAPEIASMLWDFEDGYKYTKQSNKKVDWKCPNCNKKVKSKRIGHVYTSGLSCPICSDGISYPEKFIHSLFDQLNLNFETQKIFNWSNNKRYDFYIEHLNMIVEIHGNQHYNGSFKYMGGRSLKEEIENDKLKERLASANGINHYIVIDGRKSEMDFIKNNIVSSKINSMLNLLDIDFKKCHEYASMSLIRVVSEIWNNDSNNTLDISNMLNLSRTTIIDYLNKASEIGLCIYDGDEEKRKGYVKSANYNKENYSKTVIRFSVDGLYMDEFSSTHEASRQLNIQQQNISKVCIGKRKTAGGFKWKYKEDHLKKGRI